MIPGGKPLKRDRTQRKMQSGRRNRMVIECIGLPKSGKTDLIELVEKELKRREVDYVNVSANLRHRIGWKLLKAVAGVLIYLSADARWLRDRLLGILQKEGAASSFGVYGKEREVIRKLALYAYWYRRMIRSHKLYLFDEGMVQLLTMSCADYRIGEEAFRKMAMSAEKGIRSSRLVISNETEAEEKTALLNEFERLHEDYKRNFRVLEIRREDENRKKLAKVFGRIRQILSEAGERGVR